MVQNEPSFFSHENIVNTNHLFPYHIRLWDLFKNLTVSKFIFSLYFSLHRILGIFFRSWSLLKINLETIFNNFKYYYVTCGLIPCCEELSLFPSNKGWLNINFTQVHFLVTLESVLALSCPSFPLSRALLRGMPVFRTLLPTDVVVSGAAIIASTIITVTVGWLKQKVCKSTGGVLLIRLINLLRPSPPKMLKYTWLMLCQLFHLL